MITPLFFFGERILFGFLLRGDRSRVKLLYSLIAGVCFDVRLFVEGYFGFFKQPKVVPFPIAEIGFQYFPSPAPYDYLCLQRMFLFLPRVVFSLLFWGLSMPDSLASIITNSISGLS